MDAATAQLQQMNAKIQELAKLEAHLQARTDEQERLLQVRQSELADLEQQLETARLAVPVASAEQQVIDLDVGGRHFRTYRSTLTQAEGTVLAILASRRWDDGAVQEDGRLFLDMDPEAFEEILAYLRNRHLKIKQRAQFSEKAVDLAEYLLGKVHSPASAYVLAHFDRKQICISFGLMFDLFIRGPRCVVLCVLEMSFSAAAEVTIFTRNGSFETVENSPEEWSQVCSVHVQTGWNRISHPQFETMCVEGCTPRAVYVHCSKEVLSYSADTSDAHFEVASTSASASFDQRLVCNSGKLMGKQPFCTARESGGRFFRGKIEYMVS